MILTKRAQYRHQVEGGVEAVAFDRYLRSRNRYKLELIEQVVGEVSDGPLLDWSGGYASFGSEVLRRRPMPSVRVCSDAWSVRLARRRGAAAQQVLFRAAGTPLPLRGSSFRVVLSANFLHEWDRPGLLFSEVHRLLAPGGLAVVNDLRRDAEPFLIEFVLRELAGGPARVAGVGARAFARSLASAYTPAEVREALDRAGTAGARVEEQPMTLTVWIRKDE
jgi:SAM-dependent methyltransferase